MYVGFALCWEDISVVLTEQQNKNIFDPLSQGQL
jgi:hypothetical protein